LSSDLIAIFRDIHDPREPNARHDLGDLLFVALAAMLCGAKTCVDMAEFAEDRLAELREAVPLHHGAPSHDTFSRVFRLLDPAELEWAFKQCLSAIHKEMGARAPKGIVALDGKSLKRGYDKGRAFMPPLMVEIFNAETRLTLAQTRAKGGAEVATALDLLKGLVLKGCTVTADALHCHAGMAKAVRERKAHYVLGLKANRSSLFADAEAAFADPKHRPAVFETKETSHGRTDIRRAAVLPAAVLARDPGYEGLAAIGRIDAERAIEGKTAASRRYVILSRPLKPERLIEVVRAHWSIENQLHWMLDVVFREDEARTRKDYAPENLAALRRIALNLLRASPLDRSIQGKMNRAARSKDFLFSLFTQMR